MRVIGYVRELPGHQQADTAFAQSERIRRWVRDTGNELVATCEDQHASAPNERPGYRALVEVVRTGVVDAVVVASVDALASDKVLQEILFTDIRTAGVSIISTDVTDHDVLFERPDDHVRMVVRDVVAKVMEYHDAYGMAGTEPESIEQVIALTGNDEATHAPDDPADVVVELIAPSA
jgi:hypothetical protein